VVELTETLPRLTPGATATYLVRTGWTRMGERNTGTVWIRPAYGDDDCYLFQPEDPACPDYALRVGALIAALAAAESRSQDAILADLCPAADDAAGSRRDRLELVRAEDQDRSVQQHAGAMVAQRIEYERHLHGVEQIARHATQRAARLDAGVDRLAEALLPWPLQDGESAFDMAVRVLQRAERVEAEAERQARCGFVHGGRPKGWTCLDEVREAHDPKARMSDEYRAKVLRLGYACNGCRLRAALASGSFDPVQMADDVAIVEANADMAPPHRVREWKSEGVHRIAVERERQVIDEGYDADHDDQHAAGRLVDAAICYAMAGQAAARGEDLHERYGTRPDSGVGLPALWRWPWMPRDWKPSHDPIRNLVRAAALLAAEIDRLQRKLEERSDGLG
jgi:hypothetical protein